jgi:DNA polymerase-3 subunit delta'
MINFTNKSSFNDDYKIIIIDNVEHLNINSVNALLKIIEEPNNKIYFFLIHDNKINILDTLKSRCIKFNFLLNSQAKTKIINQLLNNDFYNNLNDDFKNIYNSPGDLVLLNDFFKENNVDVNISIDDFLKMIIEKSLFKKSFYIKSNLYYFFELYFNKKINYFRSKDKFYYFYKYFLSKISDSNKYNLDIESILIEFNGKMLNG